MAEPNDAIEARKARIARKTEAMAAQEMIGISIAVLGPGLTADTADSRKRQQIHAELERDGHRPFFPEKYITSTPVGEPILDQERWLLSDPDVHLVIILHTCGHGTTSEITDFRQVPEIRSKTAILYPIEHYTPDKSVAPNTVREYHTRMPYSEEQFDACQIVAECRKWANDRATGRWPGIMPLDF